jgi:hypothetical protein
MMQTAVGKVDDLASSPTFSRLETRATRTDVMAINRVLVEQFIASHATSPEELILDVDASDVPLHGAQELTQFHGYYDHYCYLPRAHPARLASSAARRLPTRRWRAVSIAHTKCCPGTLTKNGGKGAVRPKLALLPIS